MKTLQKLTLVAFAVLSAGAASAQSAQCTNCAPPTRPTATAGGDPKCLGCMPTENKLTSVQDAVNARTNGTNNNAFVFQNGHDQYACVEQIGANGNTADLLQDAKDDKADYGNNAWQKQDNNGSAAKGKNVAYGAQYGDRSTLVQNQSGSGNRARAVQGDQDFNTAYQEQVGYSNRAYVDQDGAFNQTSMQLQISGGGGGTGHDNYSTVTQRTDHAWSATIQEGQNNAVSVYQH